MMQSNLFQENIEVDLLTDQAGETFSNPDSLSGLLVPMSPLAEAETTTLLDYFIEPAPTGNTQDTQIINEAVVSAVLENAPQESLAQATSFDDLKTEIDVQLEKTNSISGKKLAKILVKIIESRSQNDLDEQNDLIKSVKSTLSSPDSPLKVENNNLVFQTNQKKVLIKSDFGFGKPPFDLFEKYLEIEMKRSIRSQMVEQAPFILGQRLQIYMLRALPQFNLFETKFAFNPRTSLEAAKLKATQLEVSSKQGRKIETPIVSAVSYSQDSQSLQQNFSILSLKDSVSSSKYEEIYNNLSDFYKDVLTGAQYVLEQFEPVTKEGIGYYEKVVRPDFEKFSKERRPLDIIVSTNKSKRENAIKIILLNDSIQNLPGLYGQVASFTKLEQLVDYFKTGFIFDEIKTDELTKKETTIQVNILDEIETQLKTSNQLTSLVQKKIAQLRSLQAEAKNCEIDHIMVIIHSSIVSPLNKSTAARGSADHNLAILVPKSVNKCRTHGSALERKVPLKDISNLSIYFFDLSTATLTHDEFLGKLIGCLDLTKAKLILKHYVYGSIEIAYTRIKSWQERNGIPDEVSLPLLELVLNIEKQRANLYGLRSSKKLVASQLSDEKFANFCKAETEKNITRITTLIKQKNTLDKLVFALESDADKYKKYENYIQKELDKLIETLEEFPYHQESVLIEFMKKSREYVELYDPLLEDKNNTLFEKLIRIINNVKDLLPRIKPDEASILTSNSIGNRFKQDTFKLFCECLEEVAQDYDLVKLRLAES